MTTETPRNACQRVGRLAPRPRELLLSEALDAAFGFVDSPGTRRPLLIM